MTATIALVVSVLACAGAVAAAYYARSANEHAKRVDDERLQRERAEKRVEAAENVYAVAHDYMNMLTVYAGQEDHRARVEGLRQRLDVIIETADMGLADLSTALTEVDAGADPQRTLRPVLNELYGEMTRGRADAARAGSDHF